MKFIVNKMPRKFRWTIHNVIAHPLCELFHLLGAKDLSDHIHDSTIPDDDLEQNLESIMNPKRND